MSTNCFCHFNGYEVKDANARANIETLTSEQNVLSSRVDNLTANSGASTEGNAELIDIRVGYDGTTYNTAGESVRNQVTDLYDNLDSVRNLMYDNIKLLDYAKWENGSISFPGEIEMDGYFRTQYIYVDPDTLLYITTGNNAVFLFEYDKNNNVIERDPVYCGMKYTADSIHTLTSTTRKIRVVVRSEPADESATIEIVNNISVDKKKEKQPLNPYYHLIASPNDIIFSGFINATNGEVNYADGWKYSNFIDISGISTFRCVVPVFYYENVGGLAFYDENKTYIDGVAGNVDVSGTYEVRNISVPSNTKYVRFSFRTSQLSDFYAKVDNIVTMNNNGMTMFKRIGVISDSISVGWCIDKNGNPSRRNTDISWVQQMARKLGCTAYNLGASGVDPIEWFDPNFEFAEYCYTQYQNTEECDLYIIGLGLNGGTLGSVSDIKSDYTQNGNTFYGQYARIIQMINAEHPNAIVICLTEPTTAINNYDTAVRNICDLENVNVILVDLETHYFDLFNSPEIVTQKQPDGIHYTPYGYSLIASATVEALNDYISKNSDLFKYVGVE